MLDGWRQFDWTHREYKIITPFVFTFDNVPYRYRVVVNVCGTSCRRPIAHFSNLEFQGKLDFNEWTVCLIQTMLWNYSPAEVRLCRYSGWRMLVSLQLDAPFDRLKGDSLVCIGYQLRIGISNEDLQ
jgi:hypothetical protein